MRDAASLLRMARRRAGFTQRELARRAGVPQPTISRIEAGRISPSFATLVPLVEACGMEIALVERLGAGVDRSLIDQRLAMSPAERIRRAVGDWEEIERFRAQGLDPQQGS